MSDVFVSYASEDRETVVRPLVQALQQRGLDVWWDEQVLEPGDSLRQRIDQGLLESDWGVVVLSPHFLAKRWPATELDALLFREMEGTRVLLPVWHQVSAAQIARSSPLMASRIGIDTAGGVDAVCDALLRAMGRSSPAGPSRGVDGAGLRLFWRSIPDLGVSAASQTLMSDPERFVGEAVGEFRILEAVGSGGAGVVFRAEHEATSRPVALKMFWPAGGDLDELYRATRRAVRGLGTIRNPGIAELFDFGAYTTGAGGSPWIATEFVQGEILGAWRERHRDRCAALRVAIQLAAALDVAHSCEFIGDHGFSEHGILHGDINPSNVIVREVDDWPVLVDFMIPDVQRVVTRGSSNLRGWSKQGSRYEYVDLSTAAYGTPGFMSPEQDVDGVVTPRSDVYSLGMTFVELFWPAVPDRFRTRGPYSEDHSGDPLQDAVADLVKRMIRPQPEDRPGTANEVHSALQSIESLEPAPSGPEARPRP